jgi:hypothetical protein
LFRVGGLVLDGETFVKNLHSSLEEQRVWENTGTETEKESDRERERERTV